MDDMSNMSQKLKLLLKKKKNARERAKKKKKQKKLQKPKEDVVVVVVVVTAVVKLNSAVKQQHVILNPRGVYRSTSQSLTAPPQHSFQIPKW